MNGFIVLKIVFAFNLYTQIHEDAGKYQVEAKPHFEGRSLGGIFDSAEDIHLPFISQVHNFEATESSVLFDDGDITPRSKIKIRSKSKKLAHSSEELHIRKKHKSTKKKHKKKGKKNMSVKTFVRDENNQTESGGQKAKPFDIVVHIKVNDYDVNDD